MKKGLFYTITGLAVVIFAILLSYADPVFQKPGPAAKKGAVDLSNWDFSRDGPVSLDGEWACYDGQLLTPGDFKDAGAPIPAPTGYVDLTASRLRNPSRGGILPMRVRTYRLIIKTAASSRTYGLTVDNINMCSLVYVNGIKQGMSGVPAPKNGGYRQSPRPYNVYFQLSGSQTEILLQTANFDNPFPGARYILKFGPQTAISASTEITCAIELCGAVTTFLIAFFYLYLYFYFASKKKKREFLFAAVEFFGLTASFSTHGNKLIYFLFPSLPFELFFRLRTLCTMVIFLSIAEYARSVEKTLFPAWYLWITRSVCLLSSIFILFAPYSTYIRFAYPWAFFLTLAHLYFIWLLIRAYRKGAGEGYYRKELFLSGICLGFLLVCLINNFLFDFGWVSSKAVNSVSLCLFMLFSMEVIALRLLESMQRSAQNEIAFLQAQIRPHFIYNVLNTIISFCYTDGERAAGLLTDFSQYLRLTFDLGDTGQTIRLGQEIEMIRAYVRIEQARFGDKIRVEYDIGEGLSERRIPPLIIQPLVENAVKHGILPGAGDGLVAVSARDSEGKTVITVKDTGVGMPAEHVARIERREQIKDGVGLLNVCHRIDRWEQARIRFSSRVGEGTTVTITIAPERLKKKSRWFLSPRRYN